MKAFICSIDTEEGTIDGAVLPDDIVDIALPTPTIDGAKELLEIHHPELFQAISELTTTAENGDSYIAWLGSIRLKIPPMPSKESRMLRYAVERYMTDISQFDNEMYSFVLRGEVTLHDEARYYIEHIDEPCSQYAYIERVVCEIDVYQDGSQIWTPRLRVGIPVDDDFDKYIVVDIPPETTASLEPTRIRSNPLWNQLVARRKATTTAYHNNPKSRETQEKTHDIVLLQTALSALETIRPRVKRLFLRQSHEQEQQTFDDEYQRLLSKSDDIQRAYNIQSLYWFDPTRRADAMTSRRRELISRNDVAELGDGWGDIELERIEQDLHQQQQLDLAKLRTLLSTVAEGQLYGHGFDNAQRAMRRQQLYSVFYAEYDEPLDSGWYRAIDTFLPGAKITAQHPVLRAALRERQEDTRYHLQREELLRNAIQAEFHAESPQGLEEFWREVYYEAADELQIFPYLENDIERDELICKVQQKTCLQTDILRRIASAVEQAAVASQDIL